MELKHLKTFITVGIAFLLVFISSSFATSSHPFIRDKNDPDSLPLPPLENEWEWDPNPNIFSEFPKTDLEVIKHQTKLETDFPGQLYLPGTTKPSEYFIWLRIILESENEDEVLTAPGKVKILTKCIEATKEIVLHARTKFLKILEDTVTFAEALPTSAEGHQIPVVNHTYDEHNDFYTIHLNSTCHKNREYYIDIEFVAAISNETLTGLYLSTYTDPATNITKKLATTQFEAEFARQMFPHMDDPDYKAVFNLVIGRHKDYNTISNMIIEKTEPNEEIPDWYWDHFAPTPVMSSYLLAIVVSDFTCVSADPPGYKKHVEVCGPPYMIERGGGIHSANLVAGILHFYDDWMKQPYPLPKLTSVAIPDFEAGAMENWGANTYRIKGLIYYPNVTSEEARLRIDLTIAHELAHQNFGNLVTCKFWNQIWLNEGFATYVSYYGLKSVSPEYDPDTQWLSYRKRALLTDANLNGHPLVNVSNQMYYFDGISYSKGASLLRMLERTLTEEVFHEGLQFYLAKHAYGTATQWDLFDILDRHAFASGVHPGVATVSEIMETWSLQRGFPLIRVEVISQRVIALTQERFVDNQIIPSDGDTPYNSILPTFWYVPISLLHDKTENPKQTTPYTWLTNMEHTKVLYLDEKFEYIVVNPEGSTFGRVLYDDKGAQLLVNLLEKSHETLSAVTRAQIIEDAFETAWAGYGSVEIALNFTRYLEAETEPIVWSAALNALGKIYSMLVEDEEGLSHFKNYISGKIGSALSKFQLNDLGTERGIKIMYVGQLLNWAGMLELPDAIQHANSAVTDWVDSSVNRIPSDLHSTTYCNAIIGGDKGVHDTLFNFLRQEKEESIQQALASSLGCSKNMDILHELRKNVTSSDFVASIPPALNFDIMLKLARNTLTRPTLIPYLDENFDEIKEHFRGVGVFIRNLEAALQYWNTNQQLKQVEDFIEKRSEEFTKNKKRLKRIVDQIQKNIIWAERFTDPIKKWLSGNQ